MEMIFHQCISIQVEPISVLIVPEIGKERVEVSFLKKDPLPSIPSADNVIQCSWEMNPGLAGHSNQLSNNNAHVNGELTKPDPKAQSQSLR